MLLYPYMIIAFLSDLIDYLMQSLIDFMAYQGASLYIVIISVHDHSFLK